MKLSRRELAGAALGAFAARAQTPAPSTQQPAPLSPEAELQAAKLQVQANSQALAQFEIPMATEPAVTFQA
ncbi:MAG TPA: hypothetical protein VKV17_18800 [Bryobacteraceae bacterium]|nr:hypothetical protein [Bryobacteraceae bacterium]